MIILLEAEIYFCKTYQEIGTDGFLHDKIQMLAQVHILFSKIIDTCLKFHEAEVFATI